MDSRFILKGIMLGRPTPGRVDDISIDSAIFDRENGVFGSNLRWGLINYGILFTPALLDIMNVEAPNNSYMVTGRHHIFEGFIMPGIERPFYYNYAKILKVDGIGYLAGSILGGEIASGGRVITGTRKDVREIKIHGSLVGCYDEFLYYIKDKTVVVLVFHDTVTDSVVYASVKGVVSGLEYDHFSNTNNFVLTFVAENESFAIDSTSYNDDDVPWGTTYRNVLINYDPSTNTVATKGTSNRSFKSVLASSSRLMGNRWTMGQLAVFADKSDPRSLFTYCDSVEYEFVSTGVSYMTAVCNCTSSAYNYSDTRPQFSSMIDGGFDLISQVQQSTYSHNILYDTKTRTITQRPQNIVSFGSESKSKYIPTTTNLRNGFGFALNTEIHSGSTCEVNIMNMRFYKNGF